jgi:hypothetical protein
MMAEVTPDPIMRIAMGFMAAKHLFIASEIGGCSGNARRTRCEMWRSAPHPAHQRRCDGEPRPLGARGSHYRNSAAAAAFLGGAAGFGLRPMLRFWDKIRYRAWLNFESAVRSGEGQRQFDRFTDEEQQIFSAGVEAFRRGWRQRSLQATILAAIAACSISAVGRARS